MDKVQNRPVLSRVVPCPRGSPETAPRPRGPPKSSSAPWGPPRPSPVLCDTPKLFPAPWGPPRPSPIPGDHTPDRPLSQGVPPDRPLSRVITPQTVPCPRGVPPDRPLFQGTPRTVLCSTCPAFEFPHFFGSCKEQYLYTSIFTARPYENKAIIGM
jgi:hypothetical protein